MMDTKYYNTNHERGAKLSTSIKRASKQEEYIFEIFKREQGRLSAENIQIICDRNHNYPRSSIVRALCNLTEKGLIVKTDHFTKSSYDKNVHTWELKDKVGDQMALIF